MEIKVIARDAATTLGRPVHNGTTQRHIYVVDIVWAQACSRRLANTDRESGSIEGLSMDCQAGAGWGARCSYHPSRRQATGVYNRAVVVAVRPTY